MADPLKALYSEVLCKAKEPQAKQSNTTRKTLPGAASVQRPSHKFPVLTSASMANPPKKQRNAARKAPPGAAGMQQPSPEVAVGTFSSTSNALPSSSPLVTSGSSQFAESKTARVADVPKTFSFASITRKAVGLPVSDNETTYMPSGVATKMPCNVDWKIRQAMIAAARVFIHLPEDLQTNVIEQSVPDRMMGFNVTYPRVNRRPGSWSPLALLGDHLHRLKYVKILLRNTEVHIRSMDDMRYLCNWLSAIDFAPLRSDILNDGFDAVRHLSFTELSDMPDQTLPISDGKYNSAAHMPIQAWKDARYRFDSSGSRSTWSDCVALTRLCKDLRNLDLRVHLSEELIARLHEHDNMEAVLNIREYYKHPHAHQIIKFLDLQGLRTLRVLFYDYWWLSAKPSEEKLHMLAHWLEEQFDSRGQKVEVEAKFEWYEDMYMGGDKSSFPNRRW